MKQQFLVVVSRGDPEARDCQPAVVEKFREDLRKYEKARGCSLPRDRHGDYEALSWPLSRLNSLLYLGNPDSPEELVQAVIPDGEAGSKQISRLPDPETGKYAALERRVRRLEENRKQGLVFGRDPEGKLQNGRRMPYSTEPERERVGACNMSRKTVLWPGFYRNCY